MAQRIGQMMDSLSERFGIADHELISLVGAGGKTTILCALGDELASAHYRVVLTTTTKIAHRQITGRVCWSANPSAVEAALLPESPLFVMAEHVSGKVKGFSPDAIDDLYRNTSADHVLVEADGARSMSIKAPADHEPVIPAATTTAIVVAGADALGKPLTEVAHRPDIVATLSNSAVDAIVTPDIVASVLLHPEGGMKRIPTGARVVIAITKVSTDNTDKASELTAHLAEQASVDRVITLPLSF